MTEKRTSWWSLLKRETKALNSPDELWEPTVVILKDSDRRCSSKEFEILNLIASFVSFTEGGLGIWRGYTGSWRKDTNLRKGMFPECRSWRLSNALFGGCLNWFLVWCALWERAQKWPLPFWWVNLPMPTPLSPFLQFRWTLVSTECGSSEIYLEIQRNRKLWYKLLKLLDEVILGHSYFYCCVGLSSGQVSSTKMSPSCPNFLLWPFQAACII